SPGELLAKPSQKVSGFLVRRGEKCQAHLAWRGDVSPGDLNLRILALAMPKSTPSTY
ncbi:hypothetical protein A2U01_0079591, partial [Trifolium medium]|nr:hypothetical protein [Trifolium medium]